MCGVYWGDDIGFIYADIDAFHTKHFFSLIHVDFIILIYKNHTFLN